ncbi:MAG TPA: NAD(P)/FAD-dependent oxidoreductase [Candidatus Saccharimonadales bacterium]|nr:NAD(P)/FAD-dependent oxidoreductase [Candidatus Saccharimonadales bacterium]
MLDLVIVGAGHAGLAASQVAAEAGLEHLVVERGEVGQSWRTQRWDSFTMNTPNAMNRLPGSPYRDAVPEGFEPRDAWVERLGRYVSEHALPVRTHTTVTAVEQRDGGFVITTEAERLFARSVIVASGISNAPKIPRTAAGMDRRIVAVPTASYKNPGQLPPGAVLVVGSAQSGVQIAEDLLDAGRQVYLSTGRVGRAPRRLRGRDTLTWFTESGYMDQRPVDLPDPAMQRWANPQISGVGPLGHTVSLQGLAARGVTLLGRFESADGTRASFAPDLAANVAFADLGSQRARQHVDEHIARRGLTAPPSDPDPADLPVDDPTSFTAPTELDLLDRGIRSVVFSTGFSADFSWLRVPALDEQGAPRHEDGRSPVAGVCFIGFPWLRTRKSGNVWGTYEDAAAIVAQVVAHCRTATAKRT